MVFVHGSFISPPPPPLHPPPPTQQRDSNMHEPGGLPDLF